MDASERDDVPVPPATYLQPLDEFRRRDLSSRMRSASMPIPTSSLDSSEYERNLIGFTGHLRNERRAPLILNGCSYANHNQEFIFHPPEGALRQETTEARIERYSIDRTESNDLPLGKYEHLLKSGRLGMCNDPYCTICPVCDNVKECQKPSRTSETFNTETQNMLRGDARSRAKRMWSFLLCFIPGVMNPHTKVVQLWNKFFVISCSFAGFIDPLLFFVLYVHQDNKCIVFNWPMTTAIVVLRSMADFIYLLHILLQFRLAYVAQTSRADLVDDPKLIARNYLFGYFIIDVIAVLPLPQIIILSISPAYIHGVGYAMDFLRVAILAQNIPRLYRLFLLVIGSSSTGWAEFVINLFTFVLASHVIGSCWYLFGLQRVGQCLRYACRGSNITRCLEFTDCGHGNDLYGRFGNYPTWEDWKLNANAAACFGKDIFNYGIYENAVNLTTHTSLVIRYVHSLFWAFQELGTLAGNQVPSYFLWEVVFIIVVRGVGILLLALMIGSMQNFLQALGRRRLEMSIRRHEVEQWMNHRCLPEDLQRQVRDSERFNWVATRGIAEDILMESLPEDLQKEIRHHLFKCIKKVRIFRSLDEPVIDAIRERLKTKKYIKGRKILYHGGLVDKMVFIVRGKMESTGKDGIGFSLSEGDVCGEELLTWCLEHSPVNEDGTRTRIPGHRLFSYRLVRCLTNVEAFVLRAADLEEVTIHFARFFRIPRVQRAIKYESPYWRGLAARRIQVAWRYRMKRRINRADSSSPPPRN